MKVATLEKPMARNDVSVKIDAEVIRLAKIAAAFEEKSLAEYLSDLLRPLVEKDVERHSSSFRPGHHTEPPRPKGKGGAK